MTHGPRSPKEANAAKSLRGLFAGDRDFIRKQAMDLAESAEDETVRFKAMEFMAAYSDGKPTEATPRDGEEDGDGAPLPPTSDDELEGKTHDA